MLAAFFLTRYRDDVLAFARRPGATLPGNPEVAALIARIKADERLVDVMPPRRHMLPGENAFWFCVMQLEEFAGMTWAGAAEEPYVQYLMRDLRDAATSLAQNRELPPGLMVHWLDFDEDDDEFEFYDDVDEVFPMPVMTERLKPAALAAPDPDSADKNVVH